MQLHIPIPIQRAMDFMSVNLAQDIRVEEIARIAHCGERHLRRMFRQATGESVKSHLQRIRIQRAGDLLRESTLPIADVATMCGFNSYVGFAVAFKRAFGMAATEFRADSLKSVDRSYADHTLPAAEPKRVWFTDYFRGTTLGKWWKTGEGTWYQREGAMWGESTGRLFATLNLPLPENPRVTFEAQVKDAGPGEIPVLRFDLVDDMCTKSSYTIRMGEFGNRVGTLGQTQFRRQWSREAVLHPGRWHRFALELREGRIRIFQDGEIRFDYRNPFAFAYGQHCKLSLGGQIETYHDVRSRKVGFRRVRVRDLGARQMVSAVREGDTLYNAGLYERAREFYLRFLQTPGTAQRDSELHFKIGMCYLRQNHFAGASDWLEKAAKNRTAGFWGDCAQLAMLEMELLRHNAYGFLQLAGRMLQIPRVAEQTGAILQTADDVFAMRGDFEHQLTAYELYHQSPAFDPIVRWLIVPYWVKCLIQARKYEAAQEKVDALCDRPGRRDTLFLTGLSLKVQIHSMLGEHEASEAAIARLRECTDLPWFMACTNFWHAMNLRGRERVDDAIPVLESMLATYSASDWWRSVTAIDLAGLYCMVGKPDKARELVTLQLHDWVNQKILQTVCMVQKEYSAAGETLARRRHVRSHIIRAGAMTRAAILFELGGDENRARRILNTVVAEFPAARCRYYGTLASALLTSHPRIEVLSAMPGPAEERSLMFLLSGLLFERRGDVPTALEMLRVAWKEDPTLGWPALIAKQRLATFSPRG